MTTKEELLTKLSDLIENLDIESKENLEEKTGAIYPYSIGKNYLIRTVTMCLTGRLVYVGRQELVLEDAAWIADTGRFSDALKDGSLREVEPFPDGKVIVGRGGLIDAAIWNHSLPREKK